LVPRVTSRAQPWPFCQPLLARRFAAEARASALEPQMSGLPSPSASTAVVRKVDGISWVWPMAPAQEPFSCARVAAPLVMIFRQAFSWSSAHWVRRGVSAARVAKERTTSKPPMPAP